jgi:hypothetical protein
MILMYFPFSPGFCLQTCAQAQPHSSACGDFGASNCIPDLWQLCHTGRPRLTFRMRSSTASCKRPPHSATLSTCDTPKPHMISTAQPARYAMRLLDDASRLQGVRHVCEPDSTWPSR